MSDQSYDNIPRASSPSPSSDDLDSLPSTSASTTSISPSEEEWQSDAEREWKESLQQLELLLTMVLVPYLGKYFGRKAAYWGLFAPNSPVLMQSTDEGKQGGRSIWSGSTRCILRLRIRACSRVLVLLKLLPRCEKRGNDRRDDTKSSSTSHITENETIPRPWTQTYDELEEATMDTPAHASGDSSLVVLLQAIIQQGSLSRLSTTRC
jgi:hypothetical protein